jgi:hypothetical protein
VVHSRFTGYDRIRQDVRVVPAQSAPGPALSPTPRRVRPPRWLDLRLVAGVALVLLAVVVGARVVSSAERTAPVLVAARDLAAGTVLTADDLTVVRAKVPAGYLAERASAVGRALARPVGAGELVPAAALQVTPPLTTVAVPLAAGAAPELHAGQRIELWLSTSACPSVVLLPDVAVQRVSAGDAALGSGTGQDVVVSVPPALAERVIIALAADKAVLRAGVLTGAGAGAPAAGPLPDLTDCVTATR